MQLVAVAVDYASEKDERSITIFLSLLVDQSAQCCLSPVHHPSLPLESEPPELLLIPEFQGTIFPCMTRPRDDWKLKSEKTLCSVWPSSYERVMRKETSQKKKKKKKRKKLESLSTHQKNR